MYDFLLLLSGAGVSAAGFAAGWFFRGHVDAPDLVNLELDYFDMFADPGENIGFEEQIYYPDDIIIDYPDEVVAPATVTVETAEPHEHVAHHVDNATGWYCHCGAHVHKFVLNQLNPETNEHFKDETGKAIKFCACGEQAPREDAPSN